MTTSQSGQGSKTSKQPTKRAAKRHTKRLTQADDLKNSLSSKAGRVDKSSLKEAMEFLYKSTGPELISPDPLELVVRYPHPADQEVAGLLASSWAYGRVETIIDHVKTGLSEMGPNPVSFVKHVASSPLHYKDLSVFSDLAHRLHKGGDWAALCLFAGELILEHGSIQQAFADIWNRCDGNMQGSLGVFAQKFRDGKYPARLSGASTNLRFGETGQLIADAKKGSAAKRLNLWLRWMVRKDSIDPGPWNTDSIKDFSTKGKHERAPRERGSRARGPLRKDLRELGPSPKDPRERGPRPADLLLPLDTHTTRLSRYLGFTHRKSPSWKTAREITDALALFDPDDPVKYDFSLCRLGILEICPSAGPPENCTPCPIEPWCKRCESEKQPKK